jgi:hypothetical protein
MFEDALDDIDPRWGVSNKLLLLISDFVDLQRYKENAAQVLAIMGTTKRSKELRRKSPQSQWRSRI